MDHNVICSRCSELPVPYAFSIKEKCWKCSQAVWLSEATLKDMAGLDYKITCAPCAESELFGPVEDPAPETRKELEKLGMTDQDMFAAKKKLEDYLGEGV